MLFFKIFYAVSDKYKDMAIQGPAFVIGYIAELVKHLFFYANR